MIRGVYESGTLAKHISCKCECKFDDRKYNLNKNWNNNKCQCDCKNPKEHCVCEKKSYFWNLQNAAAKMVNMQEVLVIQ